MDINDNNLISLSFRLSNLQSLYIDRGQATLFSNQLNKLKCSETIVD
jgi:hypothetical protein